MLQNTITINTALEEVGNPTSETLEIHIGQSASLVLLDDSLLKEWDELYDSCPWASVFQSSLFVNSWYKHYSYKYNPIVVTAHKDGKLVGLLTMAVLINNLEGKLFIVHAGHGEADIQTWLAYPYNSERFITGALEKIVRKFPKIDILFRHVAPSTPIEWASNHPAWVNRCVIESFSRPLIRMKDLSLSRREKKRINRLKEIAFFEVVSDIQTFSNYLDEIGVLYDFRHGAMFNRTPFIDDAAYRELLLTLFEYKLLAVTVLRAEGKIIASIAATVGKNKAHLGAIICHSPIYGNYSPGIVQFLLTSQYFTELGIEYFDLTPGGDPYKDRLATEYDVVQNLVITNNKKFFMWRNIRNYVQSSLNEIGFNPLRIKLFLKRQRYLIREKGIISIFQNNLLNYKKPISKPVYEVALKKSLLDSSVLQVNTNALCDLLKYQSNDGELTRWEFLEAAMRQLETGYTAYTLADGDELLCCVWLKPLQAASSAEPNFNHPDNAAILCNLHAHPKALEKEEPFLKSIIQLITCENDRKKLYIEMNKRRSYSQLILEKSKMFDERD